MDKVKYNKIEPVQFNSSKDYYGCFGNMSGGNRIKICGYDLHGSEILYQCLKYTNRPDIQEKIIKINHPLKSKWAQKPFVTQGCVDKDFENNKIEIMKLCLLYKYKSSVENNTDFRHLLLSTKEENIIEVSSRDHFWGVRNKGDYLVGGNKLGQCLMWLRSQIKRFENSEELLIVFYIEHPHLKTLTLCGKRLGETYLKEEKYDIVSDFMSKLRTDNKSLQEPNNIIRRVYQDFINKVPQQWKLINSDEYLRCIQHYICQKPQSDDCDDYWAPIIMDWVTNVKDNIAQFAANSYLCSGPTLEQDSENSQRQNLHALLWYNLTGDEDIPYRAGQCGNDSPTEREFFDNYWRPFTNYIETKYYDGAETYETDSPLDKLFNIVEELDKNRSDLKKIVVILDRLKNMRHNRGGLGHIFFGMKKNGG